MKKHSTLVSLSLHEKYRLQRKEFPLNSARNVLANLKYKNSLAKLDAQINWLDWNRGTLTQDNWHLTIEIEPDIYISWQDDDFWGEFTNEYSHYAIANTSDLYRDYKYYQPKTDFDSLKYYHSYLSKHQAYLAWLTSQKAEYNSLIKELETGSYYICVRAATQEITLGDSSLGNCQIQSSEDTLYYLLDYGLIDEAIADARKNLQQLQQVA